MPDALLYPLGTLFGCTTKVFFLGDISPYVTGDGFLTYENALSETSAEKIPVHFTCREGHTIYGQSVYVAGGADESSGMSWGTEHAVKLDPTDDPDWTGTIYLSINSRIEWKCIIRDESPPFHVYRWVPGLN